jgi:hypothetical protein
MIQKALVVGRPPAPQIFEHALDPPREMGNEMTAKLTAGVGQPFRIAAGRGHQQQRDTLNAGARHHHRAAPHFPLTLVHAVQVADARRAVLVRHEHLADDAVGKHRHPPALLGWSNVDVGRVVLRDHITSGHAVAAKMTRGAPGGRYGERGFPDMDQGRTERSRRTLHDLVAALQRNRRQEHAVRQIFETVEMAADPDFPLDRLVVRCDVLVVDGPVLAGAFICASLEVSLAQPQRDRIPQHRLAAHTTASFRIEPGLAGSHGRNLTVGKVERHRVGVEVRARVDARPSLHDRHPHAAPCKVRRQGASRRTGSDDDDVEAVTLHAVIGNTPKSRFVQPQRRLLHSHTVKFRVWLVRS